MTSPFGRRLQLITALEISAVLWLLALSAALFAFGSFVQSVKGDLAATLQGAIVELDASPNARSAQAAGLAIANGYLRSGVIVLAFDGTHRIDLYRTNRTDPQVTVHQGKRGEPFPQQSATGPFARPILGLATAFGLQALHGHVGAVDLIVRESDAAIVGAVGPFWYPLGLTLLIVTAFAFLFARVLTRQVLRPLVEVQAALERFAAGDLRPQPIAADRRSSLGALAVAYNGAIEQMQRVFDERERANSAMRQFIADAGHQLRTPLTVVRGFIAILRRGDLRSPADRERILETMHRQSALMGSLIDKLMLLDRWEERADRAAPEAIDVARLVEDVVAPLADSQPDRDVRVDARAGELAAIDPIDLSHAITNIIDNALKYTTGPIAVTVTETTARVVITIVDSGPGMDPDEKRHAFDRFFRGSRRDVDGTGLGLAIARRAIERADGTLELDSSVAGGSRFTISLPAAKVPRRTAIPVAS